MKILFHSNSPLCGTGYGQQTATFAPLMAQDHDVTISANYGHGGTGPAAWNGIDVLPGAADPWGNDILAAHAERTFGERKAGVVITLQDVWTFKSNNLTLYELNLASWVPVDHYPAPSAVVSFFRTFGARAIAMSKFGQKALAEYHVESHYVPHGIDTEVFYPMDRNLAREALHAYCEVPKDGFLVGMVAANKGAQPPRKAFPEAFLAFAELKKKHRDALLYCHTERSGAYHGCKLDVMADACGLVPEKDVFFPPQYPYATGIPSVFLNAAYNAMDVLLNPAYGEGFGVPIIEAQAAGTPVIVNDFTSMPELCGSGWTVDGELFWDEAQMTFFKKPSVNQIAGALEKAFRSGEKHRTAAREFALRYDHRRVYEEHWKPALAALEKDFFGQVEAQPVDLSLV